MYLLIVVNNVHLVHLAHVLVHVLQ